MPVGVINFFKVIDVYHYHRQGEGINIGFYYQLAGFRKKVTSIHQAGKCVCEGKVSQVTFHISSFGNIPEIPDHTLAKFAWIYGAS